MVWPVRKKKKKRQNQSPKQSTETIMHWKQTSYTSTTPHTQVTSAISFEKKLFLKAKPKRRNFLVLCLVR